MTPRVAATANTDTAFFMSKVFPIAETLNRRAGNSFPVSAVLKLIRYRQDSSSQFRPHAHSRGGEPKEIRVSAGDYDAIVLPGGQINIYKPPFAFAGTVKKALVDVTGVHVED